MKIRSLTPNVKIQVDGANGIERELWQRHSWLVVDARDVGAPHGNLLRVVWIRCDGYEKERKN